MSALKISKSHVERATEFKPSLRKYADRLTAMDKDGNGELDLAEVCEMLDEMATIEKQRRLLKWMSIISGVFALLSIAAIVGLTYAVVDLSKDTKFKSGSSLLYSKATESPATIAKAVANAEYTDLLNMTLSELRAVESITVPEGEAFTIYHVGSISSIPNTSVTVTTTNGKQFEVDQEGLHAVNATSGSRRLLSLYLNGDVGPIHMNVHGGIDNSFDIKISYDKAPLEFFTSELKTVLVVPDNTIYQVKQEYYQELDMYDLYLDGKKLDDTATIKSLHIKAGFVLECKLRPRTTPCNPMDLPCLASTIH